MIIFIRVNFGMWYREFGIGIFYFGLDRKIPKIPSWFIFSGYPKFGLQIRLIILGFYGFLTIGIYSGFWRIPGIRDFLVSGFLSLGFGIFLNFEIFIPGFSHNPWNFCKIPGIGIFRGMRYPDKKPTLIFIILYII